MNAKQLPQQLQSVQVMVRFGFRLAIMIGFAVFAGAGFGRGLVTLLWMSALICALAGLVKREMPFAANLNHWDEMTAYVALCALGTGIVQHI
ncbi:MULTISPECIES: hypothetical protein [Bradyrhizobium]|uniref:Uncharacterized protein n=3 Tax=Bradyrhizobium TaxID=374 RepID=A0A1H4VT31_9BRAD|nr:MULTISPECIES: hypothetical protein [Bradyrhizobium]MBR1201625.1 hypothetical protein [Bradyrhizobium sp. AUGA SZCCT0124]MBR1310781.1 hypothetical protein [Bradyrhizobium sp. AUGA SZCCT0051]MBR1340924.1 hypothetical protein [Bradyrhizobium sp. AUGA SZCCT0105]MBR1355530.1 hypothetical protein [Bradyrhizobium sp. AUGA SZCCT0045]MCC8957020.1 hypothetical protein [Bradyrhizobium altum]